VTAGGVEKDKARYLPWVEAGGSVHERKGGQTQLYDIIKTKSMHIYIYMCVCVCVCVCVYKG